MDHMKELKESILKELKESVMKELKQSAKKEMESLFNLNAREIGVEVAEKNLKLQEMESLLIDKEKEIEAVKRVYELKLKEFLEKELKFKEILEEKEREFTVAMVEKTYQVEEMKVNERRFEISMEKKDLQVREMKEELNKILFDKKMESEGKQAVSMVENKTNFLKNEELSLFKQANVAVLLPGSQMPLYGLLMGGLSLVLPFQDSNSSKLVLGVITCLFSGFLLGIIPPFCSAFKTIKRFVKLKNILLQKNAQLKKEMELFFPVVAPDLASNDPPVFASDASASDSAAAAGLDYFFNVNAMPRIAPTYAAAFKTAMSEVADNKEALEGFSSHFYVMLILHLCSAVIFSFAIPVMTILMRSKFSVDFSSAANLAFSTWFSIWA